jgi:hypothetical protein
MDVFERQEKINLELALPNVHPIVTLVGQATEEENHPMNLEMMNTAHSMDLCCQRCDANPLLDKSLSLMSLQKWLKLQEQGTDFWWLPGIQDPSEEQSEDEEDEENNNEYNEGTQALSVFTDLAPSIFLLNIIDSAHSGG